MGSFDFEYDGILASSYGIMVCTFNNDGIQTTNIGSKINFDTVSMRNGKSFSLINASYDEAAEYTFQICKNPSYYKDYKDLYFTTDEQRFIYRWLNRNDGFHPLKIFLSDFGTVVFMGSFNIETVELCGNIIGFELTFQMETPYAYHDKLELYHVFTGIDKYTIIDPSDDIGYIYPEIKIVCKSSGDLRIHNSNENRTTIIKNCTSGEEITIDKNLNLSTTLPSHKLYNDFNFVFFRIANSYDNSENIISVNLPCEITIRYYPIAKGVGL